MNRTLTPPVQRFWQKVDTSSDCWVWTGSLDGKGYGEFYLGRVDGIRTKVRAHRYSYEQANGPIPSGLVIDHLCREPRCVRPEHMEAVTFAENVRRGERPNRTHCPAGHPYSPENTYRHARGDKQCRECMRRRNRAACQRRRQTSAGTDPIRTT